MSFANHHLINIVHSLYGCGSPYPMALDAAKRTSPSLPTPTPTSLPFTPSTPQFIVPPSPPSTATPRHSLNPPSAPMPISQRYRPYSVTYPLGAPSPSSPGNRGFNFFGPSTTPAGPSVPPNTPIPLPPPSPHSLPLSSLMAQSQPSTTTPTMVPPSPRANPRQAAFAARIPSSRYLIYHLHDSV